MNILISVQYENVIFEDNKVCDYLATILAIKAMKIYEFEIEENQRTQNFQLKNLLEYEKIKEAWSKNSSRVRGLKLLSIKNDWSVVRS